MVSEKMYQLGSNRSVIRELFEFGKQKAAEIGVENVYDYSIGNPSIPAPPIVKETMQRLLETEDSVQLFGYTSAQGDPGVRTKLAASVNNRFGTSFSANNFYMTVGAAASISICFKALTVPGDEIMAFAPFFPEYRCFVEAAGAKFVSVPARTEDFQIDFEAFASLISEHTKGVIVNSPNNPCGVIYTEDTIKKLAELLTEKSAQYGHPIYLISDEPYREIAYEGAKVPFLTHYYDNTIVCYSYSKSLSLPGERIGYIIVPDAAAESEKVYAAVCGAGRALGYVCAPSLMQRVVAECDGHTGDIAAYQANRDLLYGELTRLGFSCVKPEGAFYLFPRSLEPDAGAFCEKAKQFNLLLVPGDSFDCPGHVRISYCVSREMIERSLPAFEKLAALYRA